jgi:hypothetical protein
MGVIVVIPSRKSAIFCWCKIVLVLGLHGLRNFFFWKDRQSLVLFDRGQSSFLFGVAEGATCAT